ncbi:retrotransposon protein, putative, ty1-copia subclass [Tanacetum coccineum]
MKSYLDTLERLGYAMPKELGVSLILNSFNKDYDQFVQNYNMHSIGKTLAELHVMLKLHEKGIPKKAETPTMLDIQEGRIHKDKKKKPQRLKRKQEVESWSFKSVHGQWNACTVEAIKSFDLILPSGLIIVLDNCHFTPTVTRGVVSISRLVNNGYIHTFTNYGISVSKDNVFYFNAIPRDSIYEIDMHNLYPNVSSIYNVSNKRPKHGLDSYYLWHCHLGHINKKRMDMLQRDGLLQPTHDESHEKCKSCISGKMAQKPFPHQLERAKDLLGLIHTFVCGPFRTVSREGATYFITFTDDFSRYGFVYLMKRKMRCLKHLRSFRMKLKINSRNRTLLEMVRSMMNLTTLPKSFWGYALETATRILNMVPTKKVERTPYEICFMVQETSRSHGPLELSRSDKGLEIIQEEDTQPSENTSKEHNEVASIEYELGNLNEPPNYKATLAGPEFDKWLEAMNTEMQSMKDNQIWILIELPPNGRTVRNKWLFKKKTDMDGNVYTVKARLVAKGYTQTYGVDYGENFSFVADIRAIRIILAIAAFYNFEIWFDEEIKKISFTQNPDEPRVYLKASRSNVAFLVLYVNDILLMGNNVTMLKEVKSWLCKCFSMKDLGEAAYIIRIKIIRDRSKRLIAFSQSAYLEKIIKKFRMENSKKGYTPMIKKPDYRKSQGAKTPTETAVKTILKYLRNTKDMVLVYGAKPKDELKVSCYVDASFQTDKDDTKSQTGYLFVLNGGAVDWKSAKQSTIAMSSIEAEYIVAAEASM